MRFDVNETLLRHLATGGGAAYALRDNTNVTLTQQVAEPTETLKHRFKIERHPI